MALKIGPRGVTIQDVQDVANNGLSKTGAATYKSVSQPTATTPVDYALLLAGGPASTYGQKYGGQPSAEYGKQMILGAAMQAKSIGDLAALQAATNRQNIESQFASDLLAGTNKLYPTYRATFNKPLSNPAMQRDANVANLSPAITDLETRLAEKQLYAHRLGPYEAEHKGVNKEVTALEAELADARRNLSQMNPSNKTAEELTAENKANAYGAYMNRMNMLSGEGTLAERLRGGAERQTITNLTPGLKSSLAQQVTPYENVAQGFANTPLSKFAQQIAVNRYGYDPALATSLFDTSIDTQSLKDQADYFAAQHPELNMSPIEIVFNQLGQDGVDQYLQQQANELLYGTTTQQAAAAQAAQDAANAPIDADLYAAYATAPSEVNSALNADQARQIMSEPNFLAQFQAGTTTVYDAIQGGISANDAVGAFVRDYLNKTGDPVTARILEELLSNVSFG